MEKKQYKSRQEVYKTLTRKMDFTNEHQLMYDMWYEDFHRFAENRVYQNVGEGFSTDDGVKWVVKNAQTAVVATPYGNRDFTPYQDTTRCNFVLHEFIKQAGIERINVGRDEKVYKSKKYISQAFKYPDLHPEYWEEVPVVIEEEV